MSKLYIWIWIYKKNYEDDNDRELKNEFYILSTLHVT